MLRVPRNNIACVPIFDTDKTASGLYIPEIARERCDQGIVKYIGPKCEWVKPGDYILFSGYTGTLVRFERDGLLIILPEDFIIAIIDAPVTQLPGLYFKESGKNQRKCPECEAPVIESGTHLNLEPRILYNPPFFEATYEKALDIIKDSIEQSDWLTELNRKALMRKGWTSKGWVKTFNPKKEDYDRR